MSQNQKTGRDPSAQPILFAEPPVDVHPKERERVEQLIALHKTGPALDFAKDVHKRCHSAASETLLLDAYGARFASLVDRKLDLEAAALMDLVRERYPSSHERLKEWDAVRAAGHGDLGALLQPLNDPASPPGKIAAIAAKVRRDVYDLRALAQCQALAPEHPWRTAAAALDRAFEAVTSGPAADDALALPEVSRSSPLAPWKMAVRAIAAYHRGDDEACEKYLAAMEPDSAAARLAPALRALMNKPAPKLTPAAVALVNRAGGSLDTLRATLKKLDAVLDRRNQPLILQEIRNAVAQCRQAEPALTERLRQHIAIRAMIAGLTPDKVAPAVGGPSVKDAYFWRLMARWHDEDKNHPMAPAFACSAWEEFRKHAVREDWFPANGPEAAALYLHMADQLRPVPPEDLPRLRAGFEHQFDFHAKSYQGQPPEIRALMPRRDGPGLYYLSPYSLLERACQASPCAENFERWMRLAGPGKSGLVAEQWCAARPNDIAPVLHLMQAAEKRNALQKAFKLMERAEQIDGLNAEVRRARLRLLVSMAMRHLAENKPKLAGKELSRIEALPQARQGDRPAFVAALRFVWCHALDSRREAAAAHAEAARLLGDESTANLLILQVERWSGRRASGIGEPARPTTTLLVAFGRVCAIGEDMGLATALVERMPEMLIRDLSAPAISVDPRSLAALGETALRQNEDPLAYAIARAGLAQGAENQARFLFLRARSLPMWEEERRSACIAAAKELARRNHDSDLQKRIGEWREEELEWLDTPGQAKAALDSAEIVSLVRSEIEDRVFPAEPPDLPDGEPCQCPACRAERGGLPAELKELVDQMGPEAVARAMAEMLSQRGKKKRGGGRPRSRFGDFDIPF